LDLVTVEDLGKEIFAEGVGRGSRREVEKMGKGGGGLPPPPARLYINPLPVKHLITIQDGGIENLVYLAFRSKIMPALRATEALKLTMV